MKTKVQVKDLKKGDVLGSGCLIRSTYTGITTPSGKLEVSVEYPNGRNTIQTWNKYTTVTVTNR